MLKIERDKAHCEVNKTNLCYDCHPVLASTGQRRENVAHKAAYLGSSGRSALTNCPEVYLENKKQT